MCWYSADHADKLLQAEAGQRLAIRNVHGSNSAVRESDLHTKQQPTPVCLIDQTTVLFRFSVDQQVRLQIAQEAEAVFRILHAPKRDVFLFSDGREVAMNALPTDLIFDVLVLPGREHLSAVFKEDAAKIGVLEEASGPKSLLQRVLQRL